MTLNAYRQSICSYLQPQDYRPTYRRAVALVGASDRAAVYPWRMLPEGSVAFRWIDADDEVHRRLYPDRNTTPSA